jgi:thiol-disulfide isomerase/thioredoxin
MLFLFPAAPGAFMRLAYLAVLCPLVACSGGTSDDGDGADDPTGDTAAVAPAQFGPDNQWFHATVDDVPDELGPTGGVGLGNRPADFAYLDQNGDTVSLYQFYGKTVQLVLMAQWCGPCQEEAPLIGDTARDLADDDIVILELMIQNNYGDYPSVADVQSWADEYGADHPVLAVSDGAFDAWLAGGFPTLPILDGELVAVVADNFPFSPSTLEQQAP